MRLRLGPAIAFGLALSAIPAVAQDQPTGAVRTPLAVAHLASVVDMPLFLRAYRVRLAPAERSSYDGANALLYGLSGIAAVEIAGSVRALAAGDGAFIPAGEAAAVTVTGAEPASILVFVLTARPNQRKPLLDRPAAVQELARTPDPLPGLRQGPYEFRLARLTLPPGMSPNPPHSHSVPAMLYVAAGTATSTADGKTEPRPAGTALFEGAGPAHQWANPGAVPVVLIQASVSPEGTPAALGTTAK